MAVYIHCLGLHNSDSMWLPPASSDLILILVAFNMARLLLTVTSTVLLLTSPLSAQGQSSGDLRLVSASGSTGGSSGRLEIYYNGRWGTVCRDGFGQSEGLVACKQLGFDSVVQYGRAETLGFSRGSSLKPIWLDNLYCRGTESKLTSCSHRTFGSNNCIHYDDVGLLCQFTEVGSLRLQGVSSTSYGRLEVYYNRTWGTVCDDRFSRYDADVACRQLGFTRGYCWGNVGAFEILQGSYRTPIWLDDLRCGSNDTSLIACSHRGVGNTTGCSHSEDVVVVCTYRSGCNGFTTKYNENSKGDGTVTIFSGTGGGASFFIALCCIAVCCYFYFCRGSSSSPSNAPTRSYSPRQSSPTPEVSHYSPDPPSYSPRTKQQAGQLVVAKATYREVMAVGNTAYEFECEAVGVQYN